MTNKDKFIEVFGFEPDTETMIPVCPPRGVECPFMDDGIYSECHCEMWWGREYKAPDNRNCGACKHRVMKVEVGKGTPPEHFWGCECCECEFEPTTKLPSVTPQEPKTGHWIVQPSNKEQGERDFIWWKCSECGQVIFSETEHDRLEFHAFCGRCGADMREVEE